VVKGEKPTTENSEIHGEKKKSSVLLRESHCGEGKKPHNTENTEKKPYLHPLTRPSKQ